MSDLRKLARTALNAEAAWIAEGSEYSSTKRDDSAMARFRMARAATPAAILALYAEIDRLKVIPPNVEEAIADHELTAYRLGRADLNSKDERDYLAKIKETRDALRVAIAASRTRAVIEALEQMEKYNSWKKDMIGG